MNDQDRSLAEKSRDAAAYVAGQYRRATVPELWLGLWTAALDAGIVALATWFALYAATPAAAFAPAMAAGAASAAGLACLALLAASGGYRLPRLARRPWALAGPCAAVLLCGLVLGAFWPPPASGDIALRLLGPVAAVALWRLALSALLGWAVAAGLTDRRAVLAGGGPAAERLMRELAARPEAGIRVVAIFDDRDDARSPPQVLGVPKLGGFADLPGFCRRAEIDLVIVTVPISAEQRMAQILRLFRVLPLPVYIADLARNRDFRGHLQDPAGRLIPALPASFQPGRRLAKRMIDLGLGSLALALLWPVMLAAAIAVRLDSPGPIFFRQLRHGFNDRAITVLKFRTMRADAADPDARRVVTRDDPRVTRVGRVLRRTSIDELPQLFNVLGGSMSLVGPRPHVLVARGSAGQTFDEMVECYSARHRLPPGMTGLAQINGWRGEVQRPEDLRRRVEHDLSYIENWSIWLDLSILLRTPVSLLRGTGAY